MIGKWGEKEKRAVLILASQKSLTISVTIISYFEEGVGSKGIISLPCILAYIVQIIVDSIIVARWSAQDEKQQNDTQENGQQQNDNNNNIYNYGNNESSSNNNNNNGNIDSYIYSSIVAKQDLEESLLLAQGNNYDSNNVET